MVTLLVRRCWRFAAGSKICFEYRWVQRPVDRRWDQGPRDRGTDCRFSRANRSVVRPGVVMPAMSEGPGGLPTGAEGNGPNRLGSVPGTRGTHARKAFVPVSRPARERRESMRAFARRVPLQLTLEFIDLQQCLAPVDAVAFLQDGGKVRRAAASAEHVVRSQPAPATLQFVADPGPFLLDPVLVHRASPQLRHGLEGRHSRDLNPWPSIRMRPRPGRP